MGARVAVLLTCVRLAGTADSALNGGIRDRSVVNGDVSSHDVGVPAATLQQVIRQHRLTNVSQLNQRHTAHASAHAHEVLDECCSSCMATGFVPCPPLSTVVGEPGTSSLLRGSDDDGAVLAPRVCPHDFAIGNANDGTQNTAAPSPSLHSSPPWCSAPPVYPGSKDNHVYLWILSGE
jgi:hypothetical protein